MSEKVTFVLAENHQEFLEYCHEIGQKASPTLRYAGREEDVRGYHGIDFVEHGSPYKRKDYWQMIALLRAAEHE